MYLPKGLAVTEKSYHTDKSDLQKFDRLHTIENTRVLRNFWPAIQSPCIQLTRA